jgi:hypothetical protein
MSAPQALARGDACPNCGGELTPTRVLDEKAFAQVFDRENPRAVPPLTDTANPIQRGELGELYRCVCGYQARFPLEAAKAPKKSKGDS